MKANWKELEKNIVIHDENMNIVETIEKQAASFPDKLAFLFENQDIKKFSYSELVKEINKFANYLKKKGIKKASRVALFLPKIPEMYIGILAIVKLGAIAMPLFEAFKEDGLELRLERGQVSALITNKELSERYEKIKNKHKLELIIIDNEEFKNNLKKQDTKCETALMNKKDTALMIFTSSTAGTPVAGIQLPHYSAVQWFYTGNEVLDLKNKNYWCTAHPAWITGVVYGLFSPLLLGSSIFILEGRFSSENWIKFLKQNKIQVLYTAPTALRLLRKDIHKSDLVSLENIFSVGEALPYSLVQEYEKKGKFIIDTYWQTEIGSIVIANIDKKPKSLGKAIGVDIIIKDDMMELETPWPSMMTGIYNHEQMYKDYFSGKLFKTNDRAVKKGDYFYFEGRKDDLIKTSGERVSPLEIENILLKHDAVKESAVIGIPDEIKGSIIKAFIVLQDNFKPSEELKQELSSFVKEHYAGHSYPKVIEFIKELPKGNSGKIIRAKLK